MEVPDISNSILTNCPLFLGLEEKEISDLIEGSTARTRGFARGSQVAQAGEEVHFLHIILSGSVRGEMIDFTGKVIKIEDIHPPRPLASAFLFGKQNRYPVTITANEDSRILSIPRDDFLQIMQADGRVLTNYLDSISNRSQFLSSKIRFLSFSTIREKLAQYLLDLSKAQGGNAVKLPHSQSQLAEMFGVTRPSVGRAISEMNREGLIRAEGRQVHILDPAALSTLIG
jgi:CRP-like cAMP-binding protein